MKALMQTTLAALMFSAMMTGAAAQDARPGQASMEINMKIMQEVMAEVPQDKMADAGFVMEKTIEKMRANVAALKEAGVKDCVLLHGEAKAAACQCAADKTDYEEVFAMMKKQATNPESNLSADTQKIAEKGEENSLACGFTKAEINAANEKIMQMFQESAPKS